MTDKNGVGVMVFGHDSEERTHVTGYEGPGAYSRDITYHNATMKQIENVVNASIHCKQFIKYECTGAVFHFQSSQGAYSWWYHVKDTKCCIGAVRLQVLKAVPVA